VVGRLAPDGWHRAFGDGKIDFTWLEAEPDLSTHIPVTDTGGLKDGAVSVGYR